MYYCSYSCNRSFGYYIYAATVYTALKYVFFLNTYILITIRAIYFHLYYTIKDIILFYYFIESFIYYLIDYIYFSAVYAVAVYTQ
jgi:hypothetical protein